MDPYVGVRVMHKYNHRRTVIRGVHLLDVERNRKPRITSTELAIAMVMAFVALGSTCAIGFSVVYN